MHAITSALHISKARTRPPSEAGSLLLLAPSVGLVERREVKVVSAILVALTSVCEIPNKQSQRAPPSRVLKMIMNAQFHERA